MTSSRPVVANRSSLLLAAFAAGTISFPAVASATDPLAVGIVPEGTILTTILRLAALISGALLVIFGGRMPRFTLMSLFFVLAVPIGLATAGSKNYFVSLLVILAALAVAAATVTWTRRLAVAVACLWPLPALYAAHLFFSGSFERSMALVFGLALVGGIGGAVFPKIGTALAAAALGTALMLFGLTVSPTFWMITVLALGSFIGQALVLWKRQRAEDSLEWVANRRERRRPRFFMHTFTGAAIILTGLVLVVVVFAPQYGPGVVSDPERLHRLIGDGGLDRPGLVISPGHNLYLSGRAVPVAIVAREPGLLSRIAWPFVGRNPASAIRRMRAVKDGDELRAMRRAAAITSQTFEEIAPMIRPGVNESEIAQAIVDSYRSRGATGIAFDSIVGSGPNAVLPHYSANNAEMRDGMVVIDIGCSVDGYASDMTRSFPVSGSLNPQQQELVDTVNAAGDAARAMLRAGVTMRELNEAARNVIEQASFGPYYLHGLGHHVGLDVHDPRANELQAGMVITIEPGIYISEGSDIDPSYWGLGVRIEDSYIITEDGYKEITSFPRSPGSPQPLSQSGS